MGVQERALSYYNHIGLMFLIPLILIFLLSVVNFRKLNLLFKVYVSNQYFYDYPAEIKSDVSWYNFLVFILILWLESLILMFVLLEFSQIKLTFFDFFLKIFGWVSVYNLLKYFIHYVTSIIGKGEIHYKQILKLETSYLVSMLMMLYPLVWMLFYEPLPQWIGVKILLWLITFFYVYRLIAMVVNSKNLLSGKVYYIILYLCALEIIPFVYTIYSIKS